MLVIVHQLKSELWRDNGINISGNGDGHLVIMCGGDEKFSRKLQYLVSYLVCVLGRGRTC